MNQQLYFTGRSPELPYKLSWKDDELQLRSWLRVLPDQRYVAAAKWNGKAVLVKIFVGRKAKRHYQRELKGANALSSQHIPTAQLLHHCQFEEQLYIVAFEWLEGQSLLTVWQQTNSRINGLTAEQIQVLQQALKLTALMHSKGIYQQDLHLDNFIVTEAGLKAIDAGAIKVHRLAKPLTAKLSRQNLAVLFAQLTRSVDAYLPQLLKESKDSSSCKKLIADINTKRNWRAKDMVRKTSRSCSLFYYYKNKDCVASIKREYYAELQALIENVDGYMKQGHLYKTGGAATVVRLVYQNKHYIIKRNNIKNISHCLKRFWRKSRAWHSYQMAYFLEMLEVPTTKALAAIEKRFYFARKQAWLITEYSGEEHLYAVFEPYIDNGNVPVHQLDSLKALLNSMIAAKISHGDLKAYNIFWHNQRFELIDLDSVKWHKCPKRFARAFRRDRARLLRNWPKESALYQRLEQVLPNC